MRKEAGQSQHFTELIRDTKAELAAIDASRGYNAEKAERFLEMARANEELNIFVKFLITAMELGSIEAVHGLRHYAQNLIRLSPEGLDDAISIYTASSVYDTGGLILLGMGIRNGIIPDSSKVFEIIESVSKELQGDLALTEEYAKLLIFQQKPSQAIAVLEPIVELLEGVSNSPKYLSIYHESAIRLALLKRSEHKGTNRPERDVLDAKLQQALSTGIKEMTDLLASGHHLEGTVGQLTLKSRLIEIERTLLGVDPEIAGDYSGWKFVDPTEETGWDTLWKAAPYVATAGAIGLTGLALQKRAEKNKKEKAARIETLRKRRLARIEQSKRSAKALRQLKTAQPRPLAEVMKARRAAHQKLISEKRAERERIRKIKRANRLLEKEQAANARTQLAADVTKKNQQRNQKGKAALTGSFARLLNARYKEKYKAYTGKHAVERGFFKTISTAVIEAVVTGKITSKLQQILETPLGWSVNSDPSLFFDSQSNRFVIHDDYGNCDLVFRIEDGQVLFSETLSGKSSIIIDNTSATTSARTYSSEDEDNDEIESSDDEELVDLGDLVPADGGSRKEEAASVDFEETLRLMIDQRVEGVTLPIYDNFSIADIRDAANQTIIENLENGQLPKELMEEYSSIEGFELPHTAELLAELADNVIPWIVQQSKSRLHKDTFWDDLEELGRHGLQNLGGFDAYKATIYPQAKQADQIARAEIAEIRERNKKIRQKRERAAALLSEVRKDNRHCFEPTTLEGMYWNVGALLAANGLDPKLARKIRRKHTSEKYGPKKTTFENQIPHNQRYRVNVGKKGVRDPRSKCGIVFVIEEDGSYRLEAVIRHKNDCPDEYSVIHGLKGPSIHSHSLKLSNGAGSQIGSPRKADYKTGAGAKKTKK